ncbi:MAG: hypothetical protein SPJ81_01640, partial [Lachnoclostridium sp.]|nr:hypothetical protein [Lachnoclostridium sp.]
MSDFLKFAYELIAQVIYNLTALFVAIAKVFVTGWLDYFTIFGTYFGTLSIVAKVLAVLLMLVLMAIPILLIVIFIRRWILHIRLKADKEDNATLYKEIGRLNKQVLSLIDEKNKILAMKVNTMGGVERIPYMGASALTDDVIPTVENVSGNAPAGAGGAVIQSAEIKVASGNLQADGSSGKKDFTGIQRFPKLDLVDQKYQDYIRPEFDDVITLEEFVENYRLFAASQMHLYY